MTIRKPGCTPAAAGALGGPATSGMGRVKRVSARAFLEHCTRGVNAVSSRRGALDYISFHAKALQRRSRQVDALRSTR